MTKSYQRKNTNKIKKIIDLGMVEDYVYDLETENHHFHVGPGALVVHNTDSVMVKFPTTSVEESFRLGEEAAERISKTFPPPVELEFEKVYNPYLLFSKKRYAGLMYTKPEKPDYIDAKGIQLVRRDNCAMVRNILKETLDIIMFEKDITKARNLVKQKVIDLENNNVDIRDLVVSKSLKRVKYNDEMKEVIAHNKNIEEAKTKCIQLQSEITEIEFKMKDLIDHSMKDDLQNKKRKLHNELEVQQSTAKKQPYDVLTNIDGAQFGFLHEYKNPQPHVQVAKNIECREKGTGPKSGERVPYVFIDTGRSDDLQYQKAEDPTYVINNKIKIDVSYYKERALMSPIESLFELFYEDPIEEIFTAVEKSKQANLMDFVK